MHLFNYFDDDNYMHVISNIQEVQNMLVNGIELKDVDLYNKNTKETR